MDSMPLVDALKLEQDSFWTILRTEDARHLMQQYLDIDQGQVQTGIWTMMSDGRSSKFCLAGNRLRARRRPAPRRRVVSLRLRRARIEPGWR
jgi:hypothetical protein